MTIGQLGGKLDVNVASLELTNSERWIFQEWFWELDWKNQAIILWQSGERKRLVVQVTNGTSNINPKNILFDKAQTSLQRWKVWTTAQDKWLVAIKINPTLPWQNLENSQKTRVAETLRNGWVFERYSPSRRPNLKIQYRSTNTNLERKSVNRRTLKKNTRIVHRYIIWRSLSKVNRQDLHYLKKFQILGLWIFLGNRRHHSASWTNQRSSATNTSTPNFGQKSTGSAKINLKSTGNHFCQRLMPNISKTWITSKKWGLWEIFRWSVWRKGHYISLVDRNDRWTYKGCCFFVLSRKMRGRAGGWPSHTWRMNSGCPLFVLTQTMMALKIFSWSINTNLGAKSDRTKKTVIKFTGIWIEQAWSWSICKSGKNLESS